MIEKIKENGKYNLFHQKFMIDSSSDLTTLESDYTCHMGDIAELPNGNYYCRHSDGYSGDLWELVEVGSGGSSGSGLPSVTSSDNGKVLKVSNGQWGKGDSDKGYSTERGEVFIQEQTITSALQGPYNTALLNNFDFSNLQEGDTCIITYDGVEYKIEMQKDNDSIIFGDFNLQTGIVDFTNYPFAIFTYNYDNTITAIVITEEIVTSISIKGETEVLIIEDSFKEVVNKVNEELPPIIVYFDYDDNSGEFTPSMEFSEVVDILSSNEYPVIIRPRYGDITGSGFAYLTNTYTEGQNPTPIIRCDIINGDDYIPIINSFFWTEEGIETYPAYLMIDYKFTINITTNASNMVSLNKSYYEILDAVNNNVPIYFLYNGETYTADSIRRGPGDYFKITASKIHVVAPYDNEPARQFTTVICVQSSGTQVEGLIDQITIDADYWIGYPDREGNDV